MSHRPPRASLAFWLVFVLVVALVGSCDDPLTVVRVTVSARPAVGAVDQLEVVITNAGSSRSETLTLPPGTSLPATFTITPSGRTGLLALSVVGSNQDGHRARGTGSAVIVPDALVDLTVVLDPDDFVVNEATASAQWSTFFSELSGRQIAAGADGSFLITWESYEDSPSELLARLFDALGTPTQNATSGTAGDFRLAQTSQYTKTPSVAATGNGYLVAWTFREDGATQKNIKATLLGPDGAHLKDDLIVSADLSEERAPVAFGLAGGDSGVAWERERDGVEGTSDVVARLLGPDGRVLSEAFPVSSTRTSGTLTLPHAVGLSAESGGGFVVAFSLGSSDGTVTNVGMRPFAADGTPTTTFDVEVTAVAEGLADGAHLAATADGFVIAWMQAPDLGDGQIRLRRYASSAAALGPAVVVATLDEDALNTEPVPAVAVAADDGTIGVAWHDCLDRGDGDGCGIHFRLLSPSGLPLGPEQIVNTTTLGTQETPSVVALGGGVFVVTWTDWSETAPDADSTAIRARVIYPPSERHDGVIGARCAGAADAPCEDGLVCTLALVEAVRRCHPTCAAEAEGLPCAEGGTCRGGACLFD